MSLAPFPVVLLTKLAVSPGWVSCSFGYHNESWFIRTFRAQQERESGKNGPAKVEHTNSICEGYFLERSIPQCRSGLVSRQIDTMVSTGSAEEPESCVKER
jgi:hypothetical protein